MDSGIQMFLRDEKLDLNNTDGMLLREEIYSLTVSIHMASLTGSYSLPPGLYKHKNQLQE